MALGSAAAEAQLLLFQLRHARSVLDDAAVAPDSYVRQKALRRAIDTYGNVKDTLPKLHLDSEQSALVREQLAALLARIGGPPGSPMGG